MTTELVILLSLFAFILFGAVMGENGPKATFFKASPMLGARIEKQIETGRGFTGIQGGEVSWSKK